MPRVPRPTSADQLITAYHTLPPEEQSKVLAALTATPDDGWMTLAEVADLLEKSPSQVTRYAKQGKLKTNGQGRGRYRIERCGALILATKLLIKECKALTRDADRLGMSDISKKCRERVSMLERVLEILTSRP
jgi:hypothetical protein